MGEVIKNGSQTKYYKILNGGIVRDAFEGDAGAIKVNEKNPKTGIEKEKWVKIGGWKDKNEAFKLIKSTHQKYKKEKNLSTDSLKSLDVEN